MKREEVLDIYISKTIENFSVETREGELYTVFSSDWSSVKGFDELSENIKDLIDKKEFPNDFEDKQYDEILFFKLRDDFKGITNDFLSKYTGLEITEGLHTKLETCPCCGFKTIEKRFEFEICLVCWWEDDGQDNETADGYGSGANGGITLTQGRYNFLKYGIYDNEREDLKHLCQNPEMYEQERIFELFETDSIIEKDKNWISKEITK